MATLKNKKKLAAVSRETPENTRNSQSQNTLDPEMAQEFISQVSEKIEARVTKKLTKEFSPTECRILGALSKLDDFLLNPQIPTCSVAVPGTSRNSDSVNREPTGDPSNSSEEEGYPHRTSLLFVQLVLSSFVVFSLTFLNVSFNICGDVFLLSFQNVRKRIL